MYETEKNWGVLLGYLSHENVFYLTYILKVVSVAGAKTDVFVRQPNRAGKFRSARPIFYLPP